MAAHVCQDCGMLHDAPVSTESAEVTIARIRAETELKIAQLQARADKAVAEMETEAQVDIAEAQAEAVVVALTAEEEASEEMPVEDPGMGAPLVIAQDIDTAPEPEVAAPPVEEVHEERTPKKKSSGLGMW